MSQKKPLNKFDVLVENLIEEFTKIPNFDLIQRDQEANRLFNMIVFRIADISSYKELVCSHFIPEVNNAMWLKVSEILSNQSMAFC